MAEGHSVTTPFIKPNHRSREGGRERELREKERELREKERAERESKSERARERES